MDINEVSRSCGLPASTLRHYEEKGLILSTGRRGLRRIFGAEVIEQLALIALGRAAGFKLEEIAGMFLADGRPQIDRQRLAAKADELERRIEQLSTMRDGLRHAAACPAPSHLECPTFRRLMAEAASAAPRSKRRQSRRRKVDRVDPSHRSETLEMPIGKPVSMRSETDSARSEKPCARRPSSPK